MITASDFLCLPYTPDLTEAGISYACRSLAHAYDRMGSSPFDRLRRMVVRTSIELAFRRHLAQQNVPFQVKGAAPFGEPDRYDVLLGGHRCDVRSFLISYREQIRSVHADPAQLLNATALVPLDQYAGDERAPTDLFLFAFLTGLVAASPVEVQKAESAGSPVYLVHAMPPAWARPQAWIPLGPLAIKSEADEPLTVELGGQNGAREFVTRSMVLPPHKRMEVDGDFHSLAYVHVANKPEKRLGIHSPSRGETYLIQPIDWGNVWVYGLRIYLTGWITREEFRQRASLLPEGSRVFQYDRTRTKNLAVPIADLRSLPELLGRARDWAAARSNEPGGSFVS